MIAANAWQLEASLPPPRRAHAREVQESFQALFQFKALVFAEEIGSILLTPLMLWHSLAGCSGALDVL